MTFTDQEYSDVIQKNQTVQIAYESIRNLHKSTKEQTVLKRTLKISSSFQKNGIVND